MRFTTARVEPLQVDGPSGTTYPIEPAATAYGVTRTQVVDLYLQMIVESGLHREDVDALLDARNAFEFASTS